MADDTPVAQMEGEDSGTKKKLKVRGVLNDTAAESQRAVVDEFLDRLYDLAAVTR